MFLLLKDAYRRFVNGYLNDEKQTNPSGSLPLWYKTNKEKPLCLGASVVKK